MPKKHQDGIAAEPSHCHLAPLSRITCLHHLLASPISIIKQRRCRIIAFGVILLDMCTPDRWSLPLHVTRQRQKGRVCGLLTDLVITKSSCMSTGFKPETPGKDAPQTSFQQAIAAVAVPPIPITAFEPQMLTFPNIRRAIVKTSDFMVLNLAAIETAVLTRHDFDQLVGFKAELLLPDINNLHFVYPDQTHLHLINKITLEAQSLPSIGFYSQQIIMPIVEFPEPLTTSLYRPLSMQTLCYCFGSENQSHFSGTSMINVDFTNQTANVREIDLRDNDMHSLRGSMAFQISNRTNSFLDESATMMLRLDQHGESSWDTRVIGAFQNPETPVINGQFIATSTADEAMMIGHFTSQ